MKWTPTRIEVEVTPRELRRLERDFKRKLFALRFRRAITSGYCSGVGALRRAVARLGRIRGVAGRLRTWMKTRKPLVHIGLRSSEAPPPFGGRTSTQPGVPRRNLSTPITSGDISPENGVQDSASHNGAD